MYKEYFIYLHKAMVHSLKTLNCHISKNILEGQNNELRWTKQQQCARLIPLLCLTSTWTVLSVSQSRVCAKHLAALTTPFWHRLSTKYSWETDKERKILSLTHKWNYTITIYSSHLYIPKWENLLLTSNKILCSFPWSRSLLNILFNITARMPYLFKALFSALLD